MKNIEYVVKQYDEIYSNVVQCVKENNRNGDEVTLVAVSKNFGEDKIQRLYDHGVRDFGESRVQEFLQKYETLNKEDIRWHFIGHLQKNKVKYIVDKVHIIHSVDSIELAKIIDKEAKKKGIIVKILLQVNISEDENKHGFKLYEIENIKSIIADLYNIKLCGYMTILKNGLNHEEIGGLYAEMNLLRIDNEQKLIYNVEYISMGMTNDYKIAIKNGSNYLRVGTGIFGER